MNPTEVTLAQYFAASALPECIAESVRSSTAKIEAARAAYEYGRELAALYEKPRPLVVPPQEPELPAKPNKTCHVSYCRTQYPHNYRGPCTVCGAGPDQIWV
jgi:hypothetical protein